MKICKPVFRTETKKETFTPYASIGGRESVTRTYKVITSIEGVECIGETELKVDFVVYKSEKHDVEWIYDADTKDTYGLILGQYRVGQVIE